MLAGTQSSDGGDNPWYDDVLFKDVVVEARAVLLHGCEFQRQFVASVCGRGLYKSSTVTTARSAPSWVSAATRTKKKTTCPS
jgi:hypothetical protein